MQIIEIPTPGYERVVRAEDATQGFRALIAVHSTRLGPGVGGLRMWKYENEADALEDVLRLSRGMTYKSAVARTGLGGGKAVLLADSRTDKSPEIFRFMGEFIEAVGGSYRTAEDVGITMADLDRISEFTRYVTGRAVKNGGSGNPSPMTALGTFVSVEASLQEAVGDSNLVGRTVAVQGIGHVGMELCRLLHAAGAKLYVSDLQVARVEEAVSEFGAEAVDAEQIALIECDVYAPCALGKAIRDETIGGLRCKVVCGAANNQLAEQRHGQELRDRGILYAPDYVVNAGGIINIAEEVQPGPSGYDPARVEPRVRAIGNTLLSIFERAQSEGITTAAAAELLAEEVLRCGNGSTATA